MTTNLPASERDRGRDAATPTEIPRLGWRDVVLRIRAKLGRDHVSVMAAGVAFFGLSASIPAIVALISIAGFFLEPAAVEEQFADLARIVPAAAARLLQEQAATVAGSEQGSLGVAAILSLLLALFSASGGVKTLMQGLNLAYAEEEKRSFLKVNFVALALTVVIVLLALVSIAFTIVTPALLSFISLPPRWEIGVSLLRWPLLAVLSMLALAVVYRYGPSRRSAQWKWVSHGAISATVIWLVASLGFSVYVQNFGSYNETYGTLGGVIILLTWMWLSAFVVLLGAQLNAESEHQTRADTTKGPDRPMGERGAYVADTIGHSP